MINTMCKVALIDADHETEFCEEGIMLNRPMIGSRLFILSGNDNDDKLNTYASEIITKIIYGDESIITFRTSEGNFTVIDLDSKLVKDIKNVTECLIVPLIEDEESNRFRKQIQDIIKGKK